MINYANNKATDYNWLQICVVVFCHVTANVC